MPILQAIKDFIDVTINNLQTFTNILNFQNFILHLGIESLINFCEHSQDVDIVL